jgi:hypothetical protein
MPTVNYAASDFTSLVKFRAMANVRASNPVGSLLREKNRIGVSKSTPDISVTHGTKLIESILNLSITARRSLGTSLK